MPRGIPGSGVKSAYYICTEGFSVTVYESAEEETEALRYGAMPQTELDRLKEQGFKIPRGENKWYRAGQRVHESDRLFSGISGANRLKRFFLPEGEA